MLSGLTRRSSIGGVAARPVAVGHRLGDPAEQLLVGPHEPLVRGRERRPGEEAPRVAHAVDAEAATATSTARGGADERCGRHEQLRHVGVGEAGDPAIDATEKSVTTHATGVVDREVLAVERAVREAGAAAGCAITDQVGHDHRLARRRVERGDRRDPPHRSPALRPTVRRAPTATRSGTGAPGVLRPEQAQRFVLHLLEAG